MSNSNNQSSEKEHLEEMIFAMNGNINYQLPQKKRYDHDQHTQNVCEILDLVDANCLSLIKIDNNDSLETLKARFPNLEYIKRTTTLKDRDSLSNFSPLVRSISADLFSLQETVRETFEELGMSIENPRPIEDGPLTTLLTQNVRQVIPNVTPELESAIATAVKERGTNVDGRFFAGKIVNLLPFEQEEAINKSNDIFSRPDNTVKRFRESICDGPDGSTLKP
jgi:hypothetical protein